MQGSRNYIKPLAVACLMLLFLFPIIIKAADSQDDPLLITLDQFVVVPPEGEDDVEQLLPLAEDELSSAGTIIEYKLAVINVSSADVSDVVLGLLVPAGTTYVDGSAHLDDEIALLQFSIDDGATFRTPPVTYVEKQADGSEVRRVASADMYTQLRLVFLRPISPDEEVTVTYRVEVR